MLIKKLPLFFFCVFFNQFVFGQCSYNLPDTVCPLQNISIANHRKIVVDLCSSRLDSLVSIQNLPALTSGGAYQFKAVKENSRYFIFTNVFQNINFYRYEFNSAYDAIINTTNVIAPNENCYQSYGYDMTKIDSLKWVAFKADITTNNFYKYAFDSLTDDSVDATILGNFGSLNQPFNLKVFGNYVFVTNLNNTITKIKFDDGFQNALDSVVISGPFSIPTAIDIIYDCVTNSYFGFVANNTANSVTRLDFGNSLDSMPTTSSMFLTPVGDVRGLKMYHQQNDWYCIMNTSSQHIKVLKLGAADNLNPLILSDTAMALLASPNSIDILADSSMLHIFSGYSMTHLTYTSNCSKSDHWIEGMDSVVFNFQPADTGMQYVEETFTDTNQITTVIFDSVYVLISPPIASFTTSGTCEGLPVNFTDETELCYGNLIAWLWTFGDSNTSTLQNPSHIYATGGTYNVTLTVYAANGDSSFYMKSITVVPLPDAQYTPSSFTECAGYLMQFTDASTAVNDSVASWQWYFGSLDSSTIQNPSYTFTTSGSYDVQLIVTNSSGCVDSTTKAITILPTPLAGFSATGTCAGGTVIFTNLTDSATNANVNYNWTFGDSNSSTDVMPVNNYSPTDSTYTVHLTATAGNGCATTYTSNVTITHPALVGFKQSEDTVCKNVPVTFIDTSKTQNGNDIIILKHWEFSDGFVADNVDTVVHAFTQSTIAFVVLTVVTSTYCDTSASSSIVVLENPAASFTYTNSCLNDSNLFASTSVPVPGDNINTYSWNFGDSSPFGNGTTIYHAYSDTGLYNASLYIVSVNGCIDSITKNVAVYPLPIANFITTSSTLCSDSSAQFNDYTYCDVNDTVITWNWNFGNSNTSFLEDPLNNYALPGTYTIQLMVTTQKGCSDTIVKPVTVKLSPSPSFSVDSICHGDPTHFYFIDLSPATGLINAWSWNFGEQGSGNNSLQNPIHQYLLPDTYNVTVTAFDTNLCFKNYSQPVIIHSNPVIGFITSNPCELSPTLFIDTSKVTSDVITQWNWITNASTFSTASTASYTFNNPGSYLVQLTATSDAGCSSTSTKGVTIYANPVASFTTLPTYATPNQTVSFNNTSQNASSYFWDFGDGLNSALASPSHAFGDTSIYVVTLIATSDKGCTDTIYSSYNVLIPNLEIAVTDVNSQLQNSLLTLSAKLVNLGNINIDNYTIVANVAELPSLVEFSTLPITVASPSVVYTLKTKVAVSDNFDPGYFCIEVQKPNGTNDGNLLNNRLCKSIESNFELLNIVPNPTVGDIQLYLNSPFEQAVDFEIYNDLSQLVLSENKKVKKGFSNLMVQTNPFRKGVYFLRLSNGLVNIKATFVKQ